MKALAIVIFTVLCANLSHARMSCTRLFEVSNPAVFAEAPKDVRFSDLSRILNKLETLSLEKKSIKDVVKMEMPELKSDIETQIFLLEKVKNEEAYNNDFIKELCNTHQANLIESLKKPLNLETHYKLSLKTVILLDEKVNEFDLGNAYLFKLTKLQNSRLEKYIHNQITDKEFIKSFPKVEEFIVEWEKGIKDSSFETERIPIFSTLELSLPEFNKFLSTAISFLGVIDHTANPDNLGIMGPLTYASHDVSHHDLSRKQLRYWKRTLNSDKRKKLMLEIRKNYLITREKLDPKSKLTLDIIYFDFHHEDTNILPSFIKEVKSKGGTFDEPYNLDSANVLTYAEIHGLILSAKDVYPSEIKESNLKVTSNETLAKSFKPYWSLMTDIWLKAYNSVK